MNTTISVAPNGQVEVCTASDEGRKHWDCFVPGQDVSSQSPEVQAACAEAHTPEVIAAFLAASMAQRPL